jgi:hypothetical protein
MPHIGNESRVKWWDPREFHSIEEWMLEKMLECLLYFFIWRNFVSKIHEKNNNNYTTFYVNVNSFDCLYIT